MLKLLKQIGICLVIVCLIGTGVLIGDRNALRRELVRLHVVAASDGEKDQALKLRVRDAVTESLSNGLRDVTDPEEARAYIRRQLPALQELAEKVLRGLGCRDQVQVTLAPEEFEARVYETFSLPAGVYESLRITIGEGKGHNWWCVAFPALCLPESQEGFHDTAVGAGFSEELVRSLEGVDRYQIRFLLLDLLGRLENILHPGD